MEILVMGPGCVKCNETVDLVKEVVADSDVSAEVKKVTDFQEMAKRGVFSTPAVVIDNEVKCVGRVPKREEIAAWLGK